MNDFARLLAAGPMEGRSREAISNAVLKLCAAQNLEELSKIASDFGIPFDFLPPRKEAAAPKKPGILPNKKKQSLTVQYQKGTIPKFPVTSKYKPNQQINDRVTFWKGE